MPKSVATTERGTASSPWLEIDRYVAAFEVACANDETADRRRFAPEAGHELYLPVLRELVRIDLELGWAQGRPKPLAAYRESFPELFRDPDSVQAIAFEEYRLRRQAGECPSPAEYDGYGIDARDWPTQVTAILVAASTGSGGAVPA